MPIMNLLIRFWNGLIDRLM